MLRKKLTISLKEQLCSKEKASNNGKKFRKTTR